MLSQILCSVFVVLFVFRPSCVRGEVTLTVPSNAAVGSIQTLLCTVDATSTDISFRWFFNGSRGLEEITSSIQHITIEDSGSTSTLQIAPVELRHGGEYECRASFGGREDWDRGTLSVKNLPRVEAQGTQFAILGESGSIKCTSANATTIFWYIGDMTSPISEGGRYTFSKTGNESRLTIANVQKSDAGTYRCTALNEVGNDEASIVLQLLARPVLRALPPIAPTVTKGGTYSINCTVEEGEPQPEIVWSHRGANLTSQAVTSADGSYSTLTIADVQYFDAGVYMCRAVNSIGMDSSSTELVVEGRPEVSVSPSHVKEGISEWVQFTCNVIAYPLPQSTKWTKNGVELTNNAKYEKQYHNSSAALLFVRDLTVDDAGVYVCESQNSQGSGSSNAILQVIEPPPPPSNIWNMSDPEHRTINISWTLPTNPLPNKMVEQFVVFYRTGPSTNQVTVPSSRTQHQLVGLFPGATYQVWVVSKNIAGNSEPSNVLNITTKPSAPSIEEFRVSSVNGRVVLLEWTLEYNGGAQITDYVLEFRLNQKGWEVMDTDLDVQSGKHCITGLTPKQVYSFRLRFRNVHGDSEAKVGNITTPIGVPAAPSKPMVSMVTGSSVRVRFTFMDLGSGILEGVTINVTTGGVSNMVMFTVSKETNVTQEVQKIVTGLLPNVEYRFSAAGMNAAGLGEFSEESDPITLEDEYLIYYIIAGAVGGTFLITLLICCVGIVICCRRKHSGQLELASKCKSPGIIREPLPARSELVCDGESRPSSGARRLRRLSDHMSPFSHDAIPREAPPYPLPPPFPDDRAQTDSNSYLTLKEQLLLEDSMFYDSDWNLKDGSQPDGFGLSQNCSTDV